MNYKVVGVDEESRFPPRVEARLSTTFVRPGYGVAPIPRAAGALVVTWDDGYTNWLGIAQAAASRGQKHTFCVTTDWIDQPSKITSSDVVAIHALGHEIAHHSKTHGKHPTLTVAQREAEYASVSILEALIGEKITTYVYPFGSPDGRNATTDKELLGRYDRVLDTNETGRTPVEDRDGAFLIPRYPGNEAAHQTVMSEIRYAAAHPVIYSLYSHNPDGIIGTDPDATMLQVTEWMDTAQALGLPCITAAEAFPAGNLLANANYESGNLGAWRTSGNAGTTTAVVPGNVGNGIPGEFVGEITVDGTAGATASFKQLLPVVPGKEYTLGVRARLSAGTLGTGVAINARLGRSVDYSGAVSGYDGNTGYIATGHGNTWQLLTSTFTVPAGRRFISPTLVLTGATGVQTTAQFSHVWFGESKFGNFA